MKVCFETFGCRLNKAEALNMEALFLANGWTKTLRHFDADLIIVRGCAVTQRAQRDTEKYIGRLRDKYPAKRIFTTGCVFNKTPDALIERAMKSASLEGMFIDNAIPSSTARAFLKIQDGCNGNCTYCIVPKFRGASVSVDFDEVVLSAGRFLACGYREIVLTGCNISLYRSQGKSLPDLIAALADIPGYGHRIRIGSLEPGPAAADVVDVIAERENVCRFLHVPIQSASNRILAEMRRTYKIPDLEKLMSHAASKIPDLGLGCDVITGFPSESDYDFEATFDFIKRHPFNNIHAFAYSERPGTMAEKITPPVAKPVRSERARILMNLVKEKRGDFVKKFKRRKVEIIVEDASTLSGWTSQYLWCTLFSPDVLKSAKTAGSERKPARKERVEMLVKDYDGDILLADPV